MIVMQPTIDSTCPSISFKRENFLSLSHELTIIFCLQKLIFCGNNRIFQIILFQFLKAAPKNFFFFANQETNFWPTAVGSVVVKPSTTESEIVGSNPASKKKLVLLNEE